MKHGILAILMVLGTNAFAASEVIYDCESSSDPDYMNVTIYKEGEKRFAILQEYYGDGDDYAEDVVEVQALNTMDADVTVYAQVPGKYPKSKLAKKATKKTQGAVIRIEKTKGGEHSVMGISGPSGNELADNGLTCTKPAKK